MPPHKSKSTSTSTSITCGEGQQNGAGVAPPLRLLLRGRAGLCFVLLWSLRGIVHSGSAFCLSRQRHGAGINQRRLHRHATAAICGSCAPMKKPCRTKNPAPAFSLPHTTLDQSQVWSLRVLSSYPRPPSGSGCAGSRCAAPFPLTCHASHPPQCDSPNSLHVDFAKQIQVLVDTAKPCLKSSAAATASDILPRALCLMVGC